MKKWMMMAAAFLMAGAVSAEILVSWDGNSTATPTNETLNISGEIFSVLPDGVETSRGSSDGWFGPDNTDDGGHIGADTNSAVGYKTAEGGSPVAVRIYNHSEQDLHLATLVFDYKAIWDTGPQKLEVSYAYGDLAGISNNTVLVTLDAPGFSGGAGAYNYPDFVVNLRSLLANYTLPPGGANATFNIQGIDASNDGVNGVVDNIAFLDTFPVATPDPVTVFTADFEGSMATDFTSADNLTSSNLNNGTIGGSWVIDDTKGGSGNYPAVITNATGTAKALMLATDDYDATAAFSSAVALDGTTTVSMDVYFRNKANDAPLNRIVGLDSSDREVFEIVVNGYDTTPDPSYRAVGFSDAAGTNHYVGSNLLQVQQNSEYNPSKNRRLQLTLGVDSMSIAWDGGTLTNGVAFKDAAAEDLAKIRFVADSASGWEGLVYDNMEVIYTAPPLEGYSAWISGVGLSGSPDADPDYDYDDDGWDNLMEYALDGNPKDGVLGDNVPTTEVAGGTMQYIHNMRADDPSLTYYLELTDNLVIGTWTNMGYTVTGTNVTGGSYDQVTNSVPTTDPQTFIRLTVED
ncbi:hypothetical protein P4B35_12805 [Pontiellaceae bacterium B12227]|nr:hypothetical protein [Pontiellaceae bacterium B12227]